MGLTSGPAMAAAVPLIGRREVRAIDCLLPTLTQKTYPRAKLYIGLSQLEGPSKPVTTANPAHQGVS
jgi:hypothetical protein